MNRFIEGFGHLATAQQALKWGSVDPLHTIVSGGRYSANALTGNVAALDGTFTPDLAPATPYEGVCGYHVIYDELGAASFPHTYFTEFGVYNGTGTALLTFLINDSANGNGTMQVRRGTFAGTLLGTTSAPVVVVGEQKNVQIRWRIHATLGEVEIRRENDDGEQEIVLLLTGVDTGSTAWNRVAFWPGPSERFSHIWVNDRSGARNNYFLPVTARVVTALPEADGTVAWTPSSGANFETVDDATPNADTDYNAANSVGLVDRYDLDDLAAFDTVHAVQLNAVTRKISSAITPTIEHVAALEGADYLGTAVAAPLAYSDLRHIFDDNPATGLPWTIDEINAGTFGQRRAA